METNHEEHHVVIIGAGISGLALALRLAKQWSREDPNDDGGGGGATESVARAPKDDDDDDDDGVSAMLESDYAKQHYCHPPMRKSRIRRRRRLKITVLEAHSCVGGRVRSIQTESSLSPTVATSSNDADAKRSSFLAFSPSMQAEYKQRYAPFAPWTISLGAEFVHGDENNFALIDDIILPKQQQKRQQKQKQQQQQHSVDNDNLCSKENHNHEWNMELVVDYSQKSPNLTIFADGKCFNWYDGQEKSGSIKTTTTNDDDASSDDDGDDDDDKKCTTTTTCTTSSSSSSSRWTALIQKAKMIWGDLLDGLGKDDDDDDMTLEEYVAKTTTASSSSTTSSNKTCLNFDDENLQIKHNELKDQQRDEILSILNAVYAVTAGTTSHHLGVNEASRQENLWRYGERNLRLNGCFSELVHYYLLELDRWNICRQRSCKNDSAEKELVSVDIVTNSPVKEIQCHRSDHDAYTTATLSLSKQINHHNNVRVISDHRTYKCDYAAVTVPLATLKANSIHFTGDCEVTPRKSRAIDTINVMAGGKVHALLKWGEDLIWNDAYTDVIEYDRLRGIFACPQEELFLQVWFQWMEGYSILSTGFFVREGNTDTRTQCRKSYFENDHDRLEKDFKDLLKRLLSECLGNEIFPPNNNEEEEDGVTFSAFDVYDWSGDEYIKGMYTSPSVRASSEGELLCKNFVTPLAECVFFAGEHTHVETSGTVQSAIERGIDVADEICDRLSFIHK